MVMDAIPALGHQPPAGLLAIKSPAGIDKARPGLSARLVTGQCLDIVKRAVIKEDILSKTT